MATGVAVVGVAVVGDAVVAVVGAAVRGVSMATTADIGMSRSLPSTTTWSVLSNRKSRISRPLEQNNN